MIFFVDFKSTIDSDYNKQSK